jgi:hypothetical protein
MTTTAAATFVRHRGYKRLPYRRPTIVIDGCYLSSMQRFKSSKLILLMLILPTTTTSTNTSNYNNPSHPIHPVAINDDDDDDDNNKKSMCFLWSSPFGHQNSSIHSKR